MDKNENKSLDAYRHERKERIAKQAKNAQKKSRSVTEATRSKVDKAIGVIIAVVLVVAIVAGSLSFAGVPQKVLKAVTIDGKSYSMAELSCYYMQAYTNVANYASQYESQYGEGYGKMFTGYDVHLSPADQTTKDEDENEITWDEYFLDQAIKSMANVKRYYAKAVEANIEMDEEVQAEIDEVIENYKSQVTGSNYSLSRYLTLVFGKGVDEGLFKKVLKEQQLAQAYQEQRQDEIGDSYSKEQIEAEYKKDTQKYDVVSFRWFTIDVTSAAAEEASGETAEETPLAEELEAQAFIDAIKAQDNYNEETFKKAVLDKVGKDSEDYETYTNDAATFFQKVAYDTIKTNVNEDAANWLFEAKDGSYVRQAGDMRYFLSSDSKTVYILFATGTPFRDETVKTSVRHILVKFPETTEAATGEEPASEVDTASLKAEAQSILDDYNKYIKENNENKPDEEYFVELVKKYSDDTGSVESGGLIEDMANDGQLVPEFEDWAFCEGKHKGENREFGSTGIVESEYGYHIMFYVGGHDHATWYETIESSLVSAAWEEEQKKFDESYAEDTISEKAWLAERVKKTCVKNIDKNLSH